MNIQISECNGIVTDILKLFAEYDRLDKLFEDADNGIVDIRALDCAVKFNGEFHWFRQYGKDNPDRKTWIKQLKKLPANDIRIPCDSMLVKADIFESELLIIVGMPYTVEIKPR